MPPYRTIPSNEEPQFLSIVCDLERTNQLNLLPDKDLVDLCPHIEPYQVTKNRNFLIIDHCYIW
jgi:hypothetical protein